MKISAWNREDGVIEKEKGRCHAYNQGVSRLNDNWEEYLKNQLFLRLNEKSILRDMYNILGHTLLATSSLFSL